MPAAESLVEALRRLEPLLSEWPHPAALVGGMAIIARVMPRHTDDIDVLVTIPEGQVPAFLDLAARHGYLHDPDETAALLEGGLVALYSPPSRAAGVGLDVIIVDSAYLARVVARASEVDLGVCKLPVASVEDLLVLKLEANRPEDIDDILSIKDAFGSTLDMGCVRAEATHLSLLPALELYFGHEG